jgi:hypothetical protein
LSISQDERMRTIHEYHAGIKRVSRQYHLNIV